MNILIGGDLVPTPSDETLFKEKNISTLLGKELQKEWEAASYRIFNLETPITDVKNPIPKTGPNLVASNETMQGIKALNPSLITLANNHILDQGYEGLQETENSLEKFGIPYIGAGKNLDKAQQPYIIDDKKARIGIYACAEHEFNIATNTVAGANPFDPLESLDHVSELKQRCDYVIVLYHGGKEHYRYPSPQLQKNCRKLVEKGADVVICQHSHCIGSSEIYLDSTIVYGQGNFIFNRKNNEFWNTSLLISIKVDERLNLDYLPVTQGQVGIRLANSEQSNEILSDFQLRSEKIKEKDFLEKEYTKFAQNQMEFYLRKFSGLNNLILKFDKRFLNSYYIKRRYNLRQLLDLQNYIECEAHRELILQGIKNEIHKKSHN